MSRTQTDHLKNIDILETSLDKHFPPELVVEMLKCYDKLQHDYFLSDYRPLCIEAARFAEIVLRMIQQVTTGKSIPLTEQIPNFAAEIAKLGQLPTSINSSLRLMIPKNLQIVYDVRNKRNIGHTGGDVDENFADATLALTCCSWVLAELVRIYYTGDINQAQKLVDSLIEIKLPTIQDFSGFLKILNPDLSMPNKILVLLHHRSSQGASLDELSLWIGKMERNNVQKRLHDLVSKGFVHRDDSNSDTSRFYVTLLGEKHLVYNIKNNIIPK